VYSVNFTEAFFCYFCPPYRVFDRSVVGRNSYGIKENVPHAKYEHLFHNRRIQFRINSQGMRSDKDFSWEKPLNCFRVVVLGDSYSFGYDVNIEDTFLSQTEEKIKKDGKNIEFLNLSVESYSPDFDTCFASVV